MRWSNGVLRDAKGRVYGADAPALGSPMYSEMTKKDPYSGTPWPRHCKTAYIGIGSNLGDKRSNCSRAIEMIEQIPGCELNRRSDWYLTKPVGTEGQDWYLNGVLAIYTRLSARELLRRLMNIEREMGRVREERWGARIIDLDILLYGREVINEENLSVPHPLMHLRKFVLVPLVQLDPHLMHPTFGMSVAELLKRIPENGQEVIRVEDT